MPALLTTFASIGGGCSVSSPPSPAAHSVVEPGASVDEQLDQPGVIAPIEQARSLERPSEPARPEVKREPWTFVTYEGQIVSTANTRIYTTLPEGWTLDRLPQFMEQAVKHYTSALADLPMPTQPLETFLFMSREEWKLKTQQMLGAEADMYLNLGRGGYTKDGVAVLFFIGRGSTLAIAAHEGWHQYTQKNFRHGLPIWLEEGIATYMEGHTAWYGPPRFNPWDNAERFDALREAVARERLIPLDDLLRSTPQDFLERSKNGLLMYYAQVWALVHFLNEGENGRYRKALSEVLRDASDGKLAGRLMSSSTIGPQRRRAVSAMGRNGPWVAIEYFNRDMDEFTRQYDAFVKQIVAPGNRQYIVRGISPISKGAADPN